MSTFLRAGAYVGRLFVVFLASGLVIGVPALVHHEVSAYVHPLRGMPARARARP